ncbi:unnamed protein product [Tuber aestivum]|uniref:Uncharacterized protein n=1 Tax=Tuber aestivum TaxID=59557 RepID=A0A292PLP3_9PEZI|nr:unnamed protein product [Tuber aestivum]
MFPSAPGNPPEFPPKRLRLLARHGEQLASVVDWDLREEWIEGPCRDIWRLQPSGKKHDVSGIVRAWRNSLQSFEGFGHFREEFAGKDSEMSGDFLIIFFRGLVKSRRDLGLLEVPTSSTALGEISICPVWHTMLMDGAYITYEI